MRPHWYEGTKSRRGNAIGIALLLVLIAIFVGFRYGMKRNESRRQRELRTAQTDPRMCAREFFLERWKEHTLKSGTWRGLLDFMSRDDRRWFERNHAELAELAQETQGRVAMAVTPREQQWAALKALLRFGHQNERPVISTIEQKGKYAVVYHHRPDRISTLSELFLIDEGGFWKIRRFAGARDDPSIIGHLAKKKADRDLPMDDDEIAFRADPRGYPSRKRAELLAQLGLEAQPAR